MPRTPLDDTPPSPRSNEQFLVPKQKRFCHEYLVDHNGTQSAIRAGYNRNSASTTACSLLKEPKIRAYIQELELDALDQAGFTAQKVRDEMFCLGTSNLAEAFDKNGALLHIHDMPVHLQRAVKKLKVHTIKPPSRGEPADVEYVVELELYDKLGTIRLGAQMHGLVKPEESGIQTHEIVIKGGLPT